MTFVDKVFKLDTIEINTITIQFPSRVINFRVRDDGRWDKTMYEFPITNLPKALPISRKAMLGEVRNLIAEGGQATYSHTEDLVA